MPHVAVVGLGKFAQQKVAHEGVQNDLDVWPGTSRVGPLYPDKILLEDVNAKLVKNADLPVYLWEPKAFSFLATPFCWMRKLVPLIATRQSLCLLPMRWLLKLICGFDEMALEVDLWFWERAMTARGRVQLHLAKTRRKKKTYHVVC